MPKHLPLFIPAGTAVVRVLAAPDCATIIGRHRPAAAACPDDRRAVGAALPVPRSTGPGEGETTKLESAERSLCGRAGLDLLRRRLTHARRGIETVGEPKTGHLAA